MSESGPPDLSFIARQIKRLSNDVASLKDDMAVLTAIAMRQDTTLSALVTEIRATHSQQSRLANRVRDLEMASDEGAS